MSNMYESIKSNLNESDNVNIIYTIHCNECKKSQDDTASISKDEYDIISDSINDTGDYDWFNDNIISGHCDNCGSEDTRITDIKLNESELKESYDMYNVIEDTQSSIKNLISNLEKNGDTVQTSVVIDALKSILKDIEKNSNEAW